MTDPDLDRALMRIEDETPAQVAERMPRLARLLNTDAWATPGQLPVTKHCSDLQVGDVLAIEPESGSHDPGQERYYRWQDSQTQQWAVIKRRAYTARAHNDSWTDVAYTLRELTREETTDDVPVSTCDALPMSVLVLRRVIVTATITIQEKT